MESAELQTFKQLVAKFQKEAKTLTILKMIERREEILVAFHNLPNDPLTRGIAQGFRDYACGKVFDDAVLEVGLKKFR